MLLALPTDLIKNVLTRVDLYSGRSIYCVSKHVRALMPWRMHFMLSDKIGFWLLTTTLLIMDSKYEMHVATAKHSRHLPRWPSTVLPRSRAMISLTRINCLVDDERALHSMEFHLQSGIQITLTSNRLKLKMVKRSFDSPYDEIFTHIFTEMPHSGAEYDCDFSYNDDVLFPFYQTIQSDYSRFISLARV
jgi:hypothetical protein